MLSVFNIFNSIMSLGRDHFGFPNEDIYIFIYLVSFFFFSSSNNCQLYIYSISKTLESRAIKLPSGQSYT